MPEELLPGEIQLERSEELIWRNVNPSWIDNGEVSSQAFRPTPKDKKQLSGAREDAVSAAEHFVEFTQKLGLDSVGVWAVTVDESHSASLRCIYDADAPTAPDPCPTGHTYIDYRDHGNSKIRKIGSTLRDFAEGRGCQHPGP